MSGNDEYEADKAYAEIITEASSVSSIAKPRTITIPPPRTEPSYHKMPLPPLGRTPTLPAASPPAPEVERTPVQVMGKNHMPAELASQILERAEQRKFVDPSPEQDEACTLLAEECAEAIQRATKIQRFGLGARPGDTVTNVRALSEELGHVQAAIDLAVQHGLADSRHILAARVRKLEDYSHSPDNGGVTRRQSLGVRRSIALIAEILFDRITKRHKYTSPVPNQSSIPMDVDTSGSQPNKLQ